MTCHPLPGPLGGRRRGGCMARAAVSAHAHCLLLPLIMTLAARGAALQLPCPDECSPRFMAGYY